MKRIAKKRLIYYKPWEKEIIYGAEEYDVSLSDENILGSIHEIGKTEWIFDELWLLQPHPMNPLVRLPQYKIGVEIFYVEVPTWLDNLIRRWRA